jgi:hypothetical protein
MSMENWKTLNLQSMVAAWEEAWRIQTVKIIVQTQ